MVKAFGDGAFLREEGKGKEEDPFSCLQDTPLKPLCIGSWVFGCPCDSCYFPARKKRRFCNAVRFLGVTFPMETARSFIMNLENHAMLSWIDLT